jgi:PPOX class probable F420-dependent enzyme
VANERARIALSDGEVADFLAAGRTLVLVTTGPDGVPDPVPMWYLVGAGGEIRMRTYRRSQKVANLRRQPRVACLVEDGERYAELRGVQLTGRVELVEDADWIADVWTGLLVRYEGLPDADVPATRAALRERAGKQVGLRLVVDRVVSWDHRKLDAGGAR